MMSDKNKIVKVIADMEIGCEFTYDDLGVKCFGNVNTFTRNRRYYMGDVLLWMVKHKILVVTKTERVASSVKFCYKKIDDFCFKMVVVEWKEGFPDDWVATTYVNGEVVKVDKDW